MEMFKLVQLMTLLGWNCIDLFRLIEYNLFSLIQ